MEMGMAATIILIVLVSIPFIVIAVRRNRKAKEGDDVLSSGRPVGAVALAAIIAAESIIELGLGVYEILPLFGSADTTAIAARNVMLTYELAVTILKFTIAVGLFRGFNMARWSWIMFGFLLFALTEWVVWKGTIVTVAQFCKTTYVLFCTEGLKYYWIGTLFFLFRKDMNAYFKE